VPHGDIRRPNVIVLHCHDLGRFLGTYGVPSVSSPCLDAFADQSTVFLNAFATAPQCSPSRASMFTGRWPHCNGVLGLTSLDFAWDLAVDEKHLAEILRDHGYRTHLLGVHHESRVRSDDEIGRRLGFDDVKTRGDARTVADRAVAALEKYSAGDRPFYLQVGFVEPHRQASDRDAPGVTGFLGADIVPDRSRGVTVPPYLIDNDSAREEIAELQGAVARMDEQSGRIIRAVRELGLDDDTIFVFTTDHGLALPRAKCTLYDPGLEVALMIRYPQRGWTTGRNDTLTSNVDLLPTILELAEIEVPSRVQGQSLVPHGVARRERIFAEMTYHDYYDPRRAIRTPEHKLIVNFSSAPQIMDPSGSWNRRCMPVVGTKGAARFHPVFELYDLRSDPLELKDLAVEHDTDVVDSLLGELAAWMHDTADPLMSGRIASPLHKRAVDILVEKRNGERAR
jgi:N-sulfoglucosamine sulfohydrolase